MEMTSDLDLFVAVKSRRRKLREQKEKTGKCLTQDDGITIVEGRGFSRTLTDSERRGYGGGKALHKVKKGRQSEIWVRIMLQKRRGWIEREIPFSLLRKRRKLHHKKEFPE